MLLRQISSFKASTVQGGNWINPIFQQKFQQKEQGSASDIRRSESSSCPSTATPRTLAGSSTSATHAMPSATSTERLSRWNTRASTSFTTVRTTPRRRSAARPTGESTSRPASAPTGPRIGITRSRTLTCWAVCRPTSGKRVAKLLGSHRPRCATPHVTIAASVAIMMTSIPQMAGQVAVGFLAARGWATEASFAQSILRR